MKGCGQLAMSALLCLVAAGPLPGHGGAPESVDGLVTASDASVVGTVAQGTVSGTTVAVSIQVERVIKGSWATGAVLAATGTLSEPSQTRAVGHAHGIFFLAKDGSGPMRLVPPMGGFLLDEMFVFLPLPDASVPAAQPAVNSSPRERVLLEVLGGMEAGPPKGPGGFVEVLAEYHAAPTPAIRAVLQSWLASGPPALTASAVQALLAEGDANTLSRVATDPALQASALEAHAFNGLKWYFRNPDPQAVSLLGQLASDNSNSMELRIAAATALARVHTKQALPYLARLLDSPDATFAYVCDRRASHVRQ